MKMFPVSLGSTFLRNFTVGHVTTQHYLNTIRCYGLAEDRIQNVCVHTCT